MTSVDNVLRRPCAGPAVWKGPDLVNSTEWVLRLSPAWTGELDAALRSVRERGLPLLKVTADDFPLPTLAGELARLSEELENGRGFVLVKRIPVERYGRAAASTVFWGLGQHLGIPVSQNAAGHMLGHARDTGATMADPATRGYQTRARLPFHTDGSDVLGLLCLRAARTGARTAVVSSAAVYNAVLARRPDLVERLYRTHFLDRRGSSLPVNSPTQRFRSLSGTEGSSACGTTAAIWSPPSAFPACPVRSGRMWSCSTSSTNWPSPRNSGSMSTSRRATCCCSTTTRCFIPAPSTRTSPHRS